MVDVKSINIVLSIPLHIISFLSKYGSSNYYEKEGWYYK